MGNLISRAQLIVQDLLALTPLYQEFEKRLNQSPGLPVSNPSLSFWTVPKSSIANHLSELPKHADIVVIGSGLTGASFSRTILKSDRPLQVVMLDARQVCAGASGRNGGHVNPSTFEEYEDLKLEHGMEAAKKIIRFRLRHFSELAKVIEEEDLLEETQWRAVEHSEVYFEPDQLKAAHKHFQVFAADMPEEAAKFKFYQAKDAIERFHLASDALGCFTNYGGALHPYKFVTGVLAHLLDNYRESFHLLTNTPCTQISSPTSTTPFYTITTPRGTITTSHVVHATNGHLSHLLPTFRSKVVPVRATMSAQRPGTSLGKSTLNGLRTFVFFRQKIGYDYMTQLKSGENELMVGGGFNSGTKEALLRDVGNADDSQYEPSLAGHLGGIIPIYFGEKNWGAEKQPDILDPDGVQWNEGRVKAIWSGTMAFSADGLPWVGRLPEKLTGRSSPPHPSTPSIDPLHCSLTASPGEWVSACYSGEGMVHAWLCARALAHMVLGNEREGGMEEWFPKQMTVTTTRWKKADAERMLARLG
ncbi:FAD dependent oxidoreductase, partial [Athelia psychrophila]